MELTVGKSIEDLLYVNEMPVIELSVLLKLPLNQTKLLIEDSKKVTPKIAKDLEDVFQVPADFWMDLTSEKNNDKIIYMEQAYL